MESFVNSNSHWFAMALKLVYFVQNCFSSHSFTETEGHSFAPFDYRIDLESLIKNYLFLDLLTQIF